MISEASLRGIILEEALARLLMDSGYQLINSPNADSAALLNQGNGLCVRGRGADHQADVLGELAIPIPFSYPIRLFVEAKFRAAKCGLPEARNALGVVNDVNEYYTPRDEAVDSLSSTRRYHYRYALFSTSGFTPEAQRFALAQQISMVDLQGPSFDALLRTVRETTSSLLMAARAANLTTFPVGQTRTALRLALGTAKPSRPLGSSPRSDTRESRVEAAMEASTLNLAQEANLLDDGRLAEIAAAFGENLRGSIALAFPRTSFMVPLMVPAPEVFDRAIRGSSGPINIQPRFVTSPNGTASPERANWSLSPERSSRQARESESQPIAYFGLPPLLEAALLTTEATKADDDSLPIKGSMFVFHNQTTAQFDYELVTREPSSYDDPIKSPIRQLYATRTTPASDRRTAPIGPTPDIEWVFQDEPTWPATAVQALIRELDREDPLRARVVRATAEHGGQIDRESVYELTGYSADRTLTGFTRPINRISQRLIAAGQLDPECSVIFRAWFPRAGRASAFIMPAYAAKIIRDFRQS